MAIGCQKHGKTESYREYLTYINNTPEQFIEAPGIRGMVIAGLHAAGFRSRF
ncbi:Isocitrate dehydrogenase kinase/phosphatase [Cedecea neteri]|uniref:Isocitrate dehydrogenase kinase/phosphatase n=1 Tax=Cedecea neteri TaxID=158822 RepID=A0A2X2V952_9ENTR|nr:Isocitrate dehydrogenase kinase/phosphatase [Cedecea neteri]